MRIDEITEAVRPALLYHWMDPEKARVVFGADLFEPRWEHVIPGLGPRVGTSMSRNPRMHWSGEFDESFIRLVIDENRLRQTNRIIPLDAERVQRHTNWPGRDWKETGFGDREQGTSHAFAEEFVIGAIRPLHRYLVRIDIYWDRIGEVGGEREAEIADLISHYGLTHHIRVEPREGRVE